uniref:Conserved oligomeric Golgi complex subunit 3 C-terminal domain-containing protein n=1 Tax=Lutzomyia longipalpis TaxID=7200 RepID=A0A1B0CS08_LUTLO
MGNRKDLMLYGNDAARMEKWISDPVFLASVKASSGVFSSSGEGSTEILTGEFTLEDFLRLVRHVRLQLAILEVWYDEFWDHFGNLMVDIINNFSRVSDSVLVDGQAKGKILPSLLLINSCAAFVLAIKSKDRLVVRARHYIQSDILNYKPSAGDLAYPDKLEMMESIALSLQEPPPFLQRADSRASMFSMTSQEVDSINSTAESQMRSRTGNSPADLHGMWYPTVRRTLVCLSRLYRCVDRPIFQNLSQEALTYCIQSVSAAAALIQQRKLLDHSTDPIHPNSVLHLYSTHLDSIPEHPNSPPWATVVAAAAAAAIHPMLHRPVQP